MQAIRGRGYSSDSFLTLPLDGSEWSASRPGRALSPGKDSRYPLDRMLGGPQCWYGHEAKGKIICLCWDQTPVVQSVVRHYTDCAAPALWEGMRKITGYCETRFFLLYLEFTRLTSCKEPTLVCNITVMFWEDIAYRPTEIKLWRRHWQIKTAV
jgi:hypothetical protein